MIGSRWLLRLSFLLAAVPGFLPSSPAEALPFDVQLDTGPLGGGSFSLVFDLIDGDAVANNTVALGNFQFGGGGATGSPTLTGGATGNLATTATLTDIAFFNEILQGFTPGTAFSFHVDTTSSFAGGTPDSLALFVVDNGTGLPVPTLDPLGADAFVTFDLRMPSPLVHAFGTDLARTSLAIAAPLVSTGSQPVAEPSSLGFVGCGMIALLGYRRLNRGAT